MADFSGVSERLITKIEANPDDYILKSDTMAKLAAGIGVPAFMLFFPDDVRLLNQYMGEMFRRQAQFFTSDSLISMFQNPRTNAGASDRSPRVRS